MNAEAYIRQHIRKILLEETEEPAKPAKPAKTKKSKKGGRGKIVSKSGAVGSGGWSGKVKGAALLAETDPGKLMSNLKIGKISAKKDQFTILKDILTKAAEGTEEMSEVYSIANKAIAKDKDGNEIKSVNIAVSVIPYRNAHKYIEWTLVGATKAFGINWETDVVLDRSGSSIVVYLK
jgi:hypothetical protein